MVIFSQRAKYQLKQIHDYIKSDSKFYAKKVMHEIISECKNLGNFPKVGRCVPEIGDVTIREIFLYSYRMIYKVTDSKKIVILAIIHCRKKFSKESFKKID